MKRLLARTNRLMDEPLDLTPRLLMVGAAVCLTVALFMPLWNLTMFAPQYPDGLRLDIYADSLHGGNGGQDVKEINVLNHYIGMRDLAAEDFTEFKWMPFVIGGVALLILRAVVHGTMAAAAARTSSVMRSPHGAHHVWPCARPSHTPRQPAATPP